MIYNAVYIGSPVEAEIEVIVFAQDAGTAMAQGNYWGGGGGGGGVYVGWSDKVCKYADPEAFLVFLIKPSLDICWASGVLLLTTRIQPYLEHALIS